MKTRLPILLVAFVMAFYSNAQEQTANVELPLTGQCESLLNKKLDFLIDGSFQLLWSYVFYECHAAQND